jgi:hypothetical protein
VIHKIRPLRPEDSDNILPVQIDGGDDPGGVHTARISSSSIPSSIQWKSVACLATTVQTLAASQRPFGKLAPAAEVTMLGLLHVQ